MKNYITLLENNPSVIIGKKSIREVVNDCGFGPFTQYLKILEIKPLEDYKLWCRLVTGEIKIYDFTPQLEFEMFKHLKDKDKFNAVTTGDCGVPTWVDEETGEFDLELGLTWILIYGITVLE